MFRIWPASLCLLPTRAEGWPVPRENGLGPYFPTPFALAIVVGQNVTTGGHLHLPLYKTLRPGGHLHLPSDNLVQPRAHLHLPSYKTFRPVGTCICPRTTLPNPVRTCICPLTTLSNPVRPCICPRTTLSNPVRTCICPREKFSNAVGTCIWPGKKRSNAVGKCQQYIFSHRFITPNRCNICRPTQDPGRLEIKKYRLFRFLVRTSLLDRCINSPIKYCPQWPGSC